MGTDTTETDVSTAEAEIQAAAVQVPGVTPPPPAVQIVQTLVPTAAPIHPLDTNADGFIDEKEHASSARKFSPETTYNLNNAAKAIGSTIQDEKKALDSPSPALSAPAGKPSTFYMSLVKPGVNCENFNREQFKATMTGRFDMIIKEQAPKPVNTTETAAAAAAICATCGSSFDAVGGCVLLDQGEAIADVLPSACVGCSTKPLVDACAQQKIAAKKEEQEMPTQQSVKTLQKQEASGRVDAKVANTLPVAVQQALSKEIKKEEVAGKGDTPKVDKVLDNKGKMKKITEEMGGSIKAIESDLDYKEKNGADTDKTQEDAPPPVKTTAAREP